MDSIVSKSMTVRDLKERIVKEAYVQGIEFPLRVDRYMLELTVYFLEIITIFLLKNSSPYENLAFPWDYLSGPPIV